MVKGRAHFGGPGAIAETWMRTNEPTGEGKARGAAISLETYVGAGPSEGPCPVALSNADQHRSRRVQDGDRHVQVPLWSHACATQAIARGDVDVVRAAAAGLTVCCHPAIGGLRDTSHEGCVAPRTGEPHPAESCRLAIRAHVA